MIAAVVMAALLLDEPAIGPSRWYSQLVEQYRRGDREAAVAEEATPEQFNKEIDALGRLVEAVRRLPYGDLRRQREAFSIPAAVMLHTDRAFALFERYDAAASAELELPPRLIALMDDEARRAFEPGWVRATALELTHQAHWDLSLKLLDAGLKRYPDDALLLLARGATLECMSRILQDSFSAAEFASSSGARHDRLWEEAGTARRRLVAAEKCYRQALAVRPGLHHARVRLGRVLQLLGRTEDSIRELEGVLAAAPEARDRYLAHLFLGCAHEESRRLDRAAAEYEQALRVVPDGQAAAVALSHALHGLGRWPASVDTLRAGVDRAGRRQTVDPWWPYVAGQSETPAAMFEALRAELTR
jgi:tetratricopeptide (TPR) repeat protein